jgi:two-component system sensor histidine kinase QseC
MKRAPTLTGHLLAWALGALLLVWGSFVVFGYKAGQLEADELTDGHLASVSALLLAYSHGTFVAQPVPEPPHSTIELRAHDYQQSLSVVMWDAQGRVLTRSGDAPLADFNAQEEGFATLALGRPATHWRVFARWSGDRSRKLMVLLSLAERDALARDMAEEFVKPSLWLLPVIALVLGLAIRRGLRPLYAMSRDVHALDIHQARLLETPRHSELAAVIEAVNRLVQRYHAAMTRERDLASEFAHELRTPLAALALEARGLREQPPGAERDAALVRIERQALRAGEVLTQLLALARAGRAELDEAAQPLDAAQVARDVVAQFAPQAHTGGRELALAADGPFMLDGHAVLLELALRNLVENSLSHTPPGTQIEVQVDAVSRCVRVCDRWPAGAAKAAGKDGRVALGLGLGHRVVQKIAAIHGARFEREEREGGQRCHAIVFG